MATIDKLDISIYVQYARRTQLIEQINQQYHLQDAASIPPQTQVIDFFPKLTELDILLGVAPTVTPWAFFYPPRRFLSQRRSPFGFARILPSLLHYDEEEEESQEERKIAAIDVDGEEEKEEKQTMEKCFGQIRTLNEWLGHIVGRIGQFLQG